MLMRRPWTDAGLSADLTLGELETQLARILRGKSKVLPLEVYQELTGLRDLDEWSSIMIEDILTTVGFEADGDGLWSAIEKPRQTDGLPSKWN